MPDIKQRGYCVTPCEMKPILQDFDTMCFKGKGTFLGLGHGPVKALDQGYFSGNFGKKGVHFTTIFQFMR